LRHAQIERWSRGDSPIHKRHAAARILAILAVLVSIATLKSAATLAYFLYFALLVLAVMAARLPLTAVLRMAATVLPFALCFALASALAGDLALAARLVIRAYLSAFAVLLLVATTPIPDLLAGLEWLRAPRFLTQVMQFLYRYLIVLMEEAGAMRQASAARAGSLRTLQFRQAAGAAGVLFARSYARAESIHRAMLARGFEGRLPVFHRQAFALADAGLVAIVATVVIGIRAL
jgi:cobalt/nickel transport system permease protein